MVMVHLEWLIRAASKSIIDRPPVCYATIHLEYRCINRDDWALITIPSHCIRCCVDWPSCQSNLLEPTGPPVRPMSDSLSGRGEGSGRYQPLPAALCAAIVRPLRDMHGLGSWAERQRCQIQQSALDRDHRPRSRRVRCRPPWHALRPDHWRSGVRSMAAMTG